MYNNLAAKAAFIARNSFSSQPNPQLPFHTPAYADAVVAVVEQLGISEHLSPTEKQLAVAAVWLTLAGVHRQPLNPPAGCKELVRQLSGAEQLSPAHRQFIEDGLTLMQTSNALTTPLQKVVHDALTSWYAAPEFWERCKALRTETAEVHQKTIDRNTWMQHFVQQLEQHRYATRYASEQLEPGKKANLRKLKKKWKQTMHANPVASLFPSFTDTQVMKKDDRLEKTIETMFRITSANSQRLSDQADTKAHIMISVNSIIISVLLSVVVRHINEHIELTVPVILLLTVNLLTIVFAILATRPRVPQGRFSPLELEAKSVNLLFFGNFYRMNFDEYYQGMEQVMNDHLFLKQSLLRDIYGQGVVLGRKYRMLKWSYTIFMFGLILSVVSFFVVARY